MTEKNKMFLYGPHGEPVRSFVKDIPDSLNDESSKLKMNCDFEGLDNFVPSRVKFKSPSKIVKELDKYVFGHAQAKRRLSIALKQLEHRINFPEIELDKSNILLFGDTGCGKSFLINNLSRITNFPLVRTNMTGISATGFVGGSFEDVFQKLIDHNGDDLTDEDITEMMHRGEFYDLPLKKNSEYAIVHVDEIDKISENENSDKDGYSKDLQNELIGYVEDSDVLNGLINTKNMLFIGTGAFVGLEKIVLERMNRKTSIGFGSPVKKIETNVSKSDILSRVRPEDLVRYGFKPELVGRFPIMINIDTLNSNDLASILDLKTSFLSKKRRILRKAYDINLRFTKGAKNFIGEYAQKTGTNARALQLAIDNVLGDVEFDAESYRGKTIYFTKNGVKGILENSNLN